MNNSEGLPIDYWNDSHVINQDVWESVGPEHDVNFTE